MPGEGFPLLLTQKFEMLFSLLVLLISWKINFENSTHHTVVEERRWLLLSALLTLRKLFLLEGVNG